MPTLGNHLVALASNIKVRAAVGDTQDQIRLEFNLNGSGQPGIVFGAGGSTPPDSTLYRDTVSSLRTDNAFRAGSLSSTGSVFAHLGDATKQVRMGIAGPASEGGLLFGTAQDTNLYRSAADVLNTDDTLVVALSAFFGNAAGTAGRVQAGNIGPGSTASVYFGSDTNLYRSAASVLKTDDYFHSALNVVTNTNAPSTGQASLGGVGPAFQAGILLGDANLYRAGVSRLGTESELDIRGNFLAVYANTTDGNATWFVSPAGVINFGVGGGTSVDTNLYRSAVDTLKTDDDFISASLTTVNNINVQSAAAARVYIGNRGPASQAGIQFGSALDTNLYTPSADTLMTDDRFAIARQVAASDVWLQLSITGEAQERFRLQSLAAGPQLLFGPGGAGALDVNLYRDSADTLRTDDTFIAATGMIVGGSAGSGQTGARVYVAATSLGNAIEFGHSNTAGYRSTIGHNGNNGQPFLCFSGEAATNTGGSFPNTFRTRGKLASILRGDLLGGFEFGTVALATGDDQAFSPLAFLSAAGKFTALGGLGLFPQANNAALYVAQGTFPSASHFRFGDNTGYFLAFGPDKGASSGTVNAKIYDNGNAEFKTVTAATLLDASARFRPPRLSAAPATPVEGEVYYDTNSKNVYTYNGSDWVPPAPSGMAPITKVTHSAQQSIANNGIVAFNTEVHDDLGWHDTVTNNGRITVNQAGTYLVEFGGYIDAPATGLQFLIRKNGGASTFVGGIYNAVSQEFHVNAVARLAAGDFIDVIHFSTSGSTLLGAYDTANGRSPRFSATLLSATGPVGPATKNLRDSILAMSPAFFTIFNETTGVFANLGTSGSSANATYLTGRRRQKGPDGSVYSTMVNTPGSGLASYGDNPDFSARAPFTLVVFFRPPDNYTEPAANVEWLVLKDTQYGMYWNTTGALTASRGIAVSTPNQPSKGQWNMAAMTYDGNVTTVYLNGGVGSVADTGNVTDTTNPLYIGRIGSGASAGSPQSGMAIGPFALWGSALTNAQLDAIYASASKEPTALVARYARVNGTTTSCPNAGQNTTILWPNEVTDPSNMHSTSSNTSRLTAPVAGLYHVIANIGFPADNTGTRWVMIYKNGVQDCQTTGPATQTYSSDRQAASLIYLNAGDYVECVCATISAGALVPNSASYFAMALVGQ